MLDLNLHDDRGSQEKHPGEGEKHREDTVEDASTDEGGEHFKTNIDASIFVRPVGLRQNLMAVVLLIMLGVTSEHIDTHFR